MSATPSVLYFDKNDIVLTEEIGPDANIWLQRITAHEVSGLSKLGCVVEGDMDQLVVTHPSNKLPFYNRYLGVRWSAQDIATLANYPASFVLSSLHEDADSMQSALVNNNWVHTLSSIVLAKNISPIYEIPTDGFCVVHLGEDNYLDEQGFELFATFFMKPDESKAAARERFYNNIHNGPHLMAILDGTPVALNGAIKMGHTASIYTGIVNNRHRGSNILDALMTRLQNTLYQNDVRFIYMKTRNRAVTLYAQRYYGVKHIYNERVYENR